MPGRFEFRVLGPFEVLRDGAPVSIRGDKQRSLLAALVIRAGEAISAEALIDTLWGEEPPPTARTGLQVQISKLRKLLDGVAIETRDSGYLLAIDADALDANRFERLVQEGRRALGEGDPERARALLAGALALWRGVPLADVDVPDGVLGRLAALEERHLAALASSFEADLALGRHEELLVGMEGALALGPMNERLHELAALTLYRAGRPADALEVLARLRRTLSTELGADPGPSVGDLERRILAHDRSLDAPSTKPPAEPGRQGRSPISVLVLRFTTAGPDPEAGRIELDALTSRAVAVIQAYGGTVRGPVNERVVALFGLPRVHEDDAERAALAALALRGPRVRAGIATGEVLVEEAAGDRVLRSAAPLDAADRLARAAPPGTVLLTQDALRLAHRSVTAQPGGVLAPEGGGAGVVTFQVTGVSGGLEATPRMRAPLVGRRDELGMLRQAFARVRSERGCSLVSVLGPAGIGKSRLIAEFLASLHDTTVLRGRCLPYGRDITFWPVAEIVKGAASILEGDSVDEARRKVAGLTLGQQDGGFLADQVSAVLGLSDVPPVADEIFWAIRKLLESIAAERPLVVVLDDVHWAEDMLLDLVEHVATWFSGPLLLVCAARPELVEARPGWGGGRLDATNLWLRPLTTEESGTMLDALLAGATLDERSADQVRRVAEGNPLFLEALLAMLVDEGVLGWHEGRWIALGDLSSVPIPPTVHAILSARLDRLSPSERRVLERAAVAGRDLSLDDVLSLTPEGDPDPREHLDALARKDLLEVQTRGPGGGADYRFRHLLLHDATYQGMSKRSRADLHAAFADALESRAGDRRTEIEEILGYHLETAYRLGLELGSTPEPSLAVRASAMLASAGRRALGRDDIPAAASLLSRALELLPPDDPARPPVAWALAVAWFEAGDLVGAASVAETHAALAERLGDEASLWRLRVELADIRIYGSGEGTVGDRESVARGAIEAFAALGDDVGGARAYRLLGDVLNHSGRVEESGQAFLRATELGLAAGDERESNARSSSGVILGPMPAGRAIELMEATLTLARRRDPDMLASLGFAYALAGRAEDSARAFSEGLARLRDLGSEFRLASLEMYRSAALLAQDRPVEAETVIRPTVEALQRMGERGFLPTAAASLGEALLRQDRLEEALRASVLAEESTPPDDIAAEIAWRALRAKLLARTGQLEAAERLAAEAVAIGDSSDFLYFTADAYADLASVREVAGSPERSAWALREAIDRYERKGCETIAARARARLERLEARA